MTERNERVQTIIVLNRDLFFGVRLRQIGNELGYRVELTPKTEPFLQKLHEEGTTLGIVDIGAGPDWPLISADRQAHAAPAIVAFGPHKDIDALREAKAAGVTRVISNGTFHRDPVAMIRRYAEGGADIEIDDEIDDSTLEA